MTDYAIDVSHHQNPATLPWDTKFAGNVDAVIVRAGYGAELRDRDAREHVRRARLIGARVGLYLFFRPLHTVQKQFDLLRAVADEVKLGPGDIVPTVDVEHDPIPKPGTNVSPAWAWPVEELAHRLDEHFGARCMIYITQREFGMLGKPAWMLEPDRPLWVAHYTAAAKPATPGNRAATMWQHRVGPFVANGPGGYDKVRPELDQNRILLPLPLLGPQAAASDIPALTQDGSGEDWDDLDDHRVLELTLTSEELGAMDFGQNIGSDAVRDGLREMSGSDTIPSPPPDDEDAPITPREIPGGKRS